MSFMECQATGTPRTKWNSHIPEEPAQVETGYTYGQLYAPHARESSLNPNSNTLEPGLL